MFSKFKSVINKKSIIFSLVLIASIVLSTIVSFNFKTKNNIENKVAEVSAQTEVQTYTEDVLTLTYEPTSNLSKTGDYGEWDGDGRNVQGGTTITISGSATEATITWLYNDDEKTRKYTPKPGYELKGFNVYAGTDETGTLVKTIEFTGTNSSIEFKPEEIISSGYNPSSNKTIHIAAVVEPIKYDLYLYYSENNGNTYDPKAVGFDVQTEIDLTTNGSTDEGVKDWKYWMLRKSALTGNSSPYTYNDDYQIKIVGTSLTITKGSEVSLKFTLGEEIDAGYAITSLEVGSYGTFAQIGDNPLLAARIARTFNLTITSGDGGWNNSTLVSGTDKEALVGACSSYEGTTVDEIVIPEDDSSYETTILIKDSYKYNYGFMDSEIDATTGLSFYKKSNFESVTDDRESSDKGSYYVFNYGYKITGYKISYSNEGTYYASFDGTTWSFAKSENEGINIEKLTATSLQEFAAKLDETFAGEKIKSESIDVTMVPKWEAVNILLDTDDNYNEVSIKYNSTYDLSAINKDGESLINYVTKTNDRTIVLNGTYNYYNLEPNCYTYNSGTYNSGTYTLSLESEYVDNMYKVRITNIATGDVLQAPYEAGTSSHAANEYTYHNYTQDGYEFTNYSTYLTYSTEFGLIETYILGPFNDLKTKYKAGIIDSNANHFIVLKKVYGSVADGLYIYLTNGHDYTMPEFTRDYHDLIFYENINGKYIYKTSLFDQASHKAEKPSGKDFRREKEDDNTSAYLFKWYLADGGEVVSLQINAHWFRKNYKLNINTFLNDNDEANKSFHGYVKVEINDTVYPTGINCKSGNYLVLCDNTKSMIVYKIDDSMPMPATAKDLTFSDLDSLEYINLYAGCEIVITEVDQCGDVEAVSNDDAFLNMVGFRFKETTYSKKIAEGSYVKDDNCKNAFKTVNNANEIEALGYTSGTEIKIDVIYEQIVYDFKIQLDNNKSGNIVIKQGTTQSSSVYAYELTGIDVTQNKSYSIVYNANAGYCFLQNKEFTLGDPYNTHIVLGGGTNQTYTFTFNSEWLRDCYYKTFDTDFSVNDIKVDNIVGYTDSNTIYVNTYTFEFKIGVIVYDSTSSVEKGIIYKTESDDMNTISLDAGTGNVETDSIVTLLTKVDDDDMWIYKVGTDNYALLNTRLYFPNNYLTTNNNQYKQYNFTLTEKPENTFTLKSSILTNMVNASSNLIIPKENRNIYIMLEVRKLYKVTVDVVDSDLPDADGDRSVTVSNGANSSLTVNKKGNDNDVVYTYNKARNTISSSYDSKYYSGVEYYLDSYNPTGLNIELDSNEFLTNNKDYTLYVKYIPKPISTNVVYKIDDEIKTEQYMLDNGIISNPSLWVVKDDGTTIGKNNEIYVDYYVKYLCNILSNKYNVTVMINGNDAAGEFNSNSNFLNHKVVKTDFEDEKIEVEVVFTTIPTEIIQVKYVLANANLNITNEPYYGEITVYESGVEQTNENANFALDNFVIVSILKNAKVELALKLYEGYEIYGVKHNNNSVNTNIEITENTSYKFGETLNIYKITDSYDFDIHSGIYLVYLNKIDVTAKLSIEGDYYGYNISNNRKPTSANVIGNVKTINQLYVNDVVTLSAIESDNEMLKYFYYKKADNSEVYLHNTYPIESEKIEINSTDYYVFNNMLYEDQLHSKEVEFYYLVEGSNVIVPNMEFTITSDMLTDVKNDDKYVINLGVKTSNKYKVTYTLSGVEYVDNFAVYVNYDSVSAQDANYKEMNCVSGSYYLAGTNINLFVTPIEGDYNIFVNNNNEGTLLTNKIYALGSSNLNLEIVVKPAVYDVTFNENIYNNLTDLNNSNPTNVAKENWVNGYTNNQKAEFGIARTLQFNFVAKNGSGKPVSELYEISIQGGCSTIYYVNDNKLYKDSSLTTEVGFTYSVDDTINKVTIEMAEYDIIDNKISVPTDIKIRIINNQLKYLVNGVWVAENPTNYLIQLNVRDNKVLLSYTPTLSVAITLNYIDYKSINSNI